MEKVIIIILNWNGKELLKDCLSSLFKLTDYPNYKVIVVDNGSNDGSVEFVKQNFPQADIIALDKNYGFSKGNNIGIKYALEKYNPEYILLLNNDTEIIQKDWLKLLVESAEKYNAQIVGCKLIYPNGKIQHAGIDIKFLSEHIGRFENKEKYSFIKYIGAVTFACVLIKKEVIEKIGLLDEIFFAGHEDLDYCFKARKNGFKILYNGNVTLIHKESITTKKFEDLRRWYRERVGGIIIAKRHYSFAFLLALLLFYFIASFIKRKYPTLKSSFSPRKNWFKFLWFLILAIKDSLIIEKLKIPIIFFEKKYFEKF